MRAKAVFFSPAAHRLARSWDELDAWQLQACCEALHSEMDAGLRMARLLSVLAEPHLPKGRIAMAADFGEASEATAFLYGGTMRTKPFEAGRRVGLRMLHGPQGKRIRTDCK